MAKQVVDEEPIIKISPAEYAAALHAAIAAAAGRRVGVPNDQEYGGKSQNPPSTPFKK